VKDGAQKQRTMKDSTQVINCTALNLRMASRIITQHYDQYLKPTGLRVTQFSLLSTIAFMGNPTITNLAQQMVTDRTTLTRNLAPLEKAGLLKSSNGEDRRIRYVSLTELGRERLKEATALWQEAQQSLVTQIGDDAWNDLLTGLTGVTKAMQER
jgi:DNA-binding MarR family transcriptional regulator